jgi:hypothetical protein
MIGVENLCVEEARRLSMRICVVIEMLLTQRIRVKSFCDAHTDGVLENTVPLNLYKFNDPRRI